MSILEVNNVSKSFGGVKANVDISMKVEQGSIVGATVFHLFKEGFWTFFLGWQYVALGMLIVVIVVFFPEGIMGWLREKFPERFGEVIDEADRKAQVELK